MRLSIITINYNNAEGLRNTLASVAAQTYDISRIELVVVDDCSNDGTDEEIESLSEYYCPHCGKTLPDELGEEIEKHMKGE